MPAKTKSAAKPRAAARTTAKPARRKAAMNPADTGSLVSDGGPSCRRWEEQRWQIDMTIKTVGPEFDQGRLNHIVGLVGTEIMPDVMRLRSQINKFDDLAPMIGAAAAAREARAKALLRDGRRLTAAESFFVAAQFYATAQWSILVNNDENKRLAAKKLECYGRYAKLADHHVERIDIPFAGKTLPAWLHLPPGHQAGDAPLPCVVATSGMDGYKERVVALYGDRFLSRGMAVLLVEGPGQYDAIIQDIPFSTDAWLDAGKAFYEAAAARPEIDPKRIGITGHSFGSFFMTIACAGDKRYRACAVSGTCLEPGGYAIFDEAPPTFKRRFMYMSGFRDEAAFDDFRKTITWKGHTRKIRVPYLCVTGEVDEKSPLVHTERMFQELAGPKQMLVYEGAGHAINGMPSSANGPLFTKFIADWMADRLAGKPMKSERWFVDGRGKITKTKY